MKIKFLFLLLVIPVLTWADSWDNLTLEQANKAVALLKKHPFIFEYCDCCDYSGEFATEVYLIKVNSTEIITCEWSPEYYSVKVKGIRILQMPYSENGINKGKLKASSEEADYIVSLNYTYVFDSKSKKAVHLFEVVPYNNQERSCKGSALFPDPLKSKVITDQQYIAWYEKNVRKK
jgi:hypothetical protein